MKTIAIIMGSILFCLGIMLASGIDARPIQAVWSLVCFATSAGCFYLVERIERKMRVYDYRTGCIKDVA